MSVVNIRAFYKSIMAGPNLEIFKFSLYLLVPIGALLHFGDPDWYRNHVIPVSIGLSVFQPRCLFRSVQRKILPAT